jgi:hypothetical protein
MTEERKQSSIQSAKIVRILPTEMWVEKDIFGTVHIKMQHEGEPNPFDFIQIQYNWLYTSNSHQYELTEKIMSIFGVNKVEYREAASQFGTAQQVACHVWCGCGDGYREDSYEAGFIAGAGKCQNCAAGDDAPPASTGVVLTVSDVEALAGDTRIAFGESAAAFNDGVDAMANSVEERIEALHLSMQKTIANFDNPDTSDIDPRLLEKAREFIKTLKPLEPEFKAFIAANMWDLLGQDAAPTHDAAMRADEGGEG